MIAAGFVSLTSVTVNLSDHQKNDVPEGSQAGLLATFTTVDIGESTPQITRQSTSPWTGFKPELTQSSDLEGRLDARVRVTTQSN
jgi:hypothetical protein